LSACQPGPFPLGRGSRLPPLTHFAYWDIAGCYGSQTPRSHCHRESAKRHFPNSLEFPQTPIPILPPAPSQATDTGGSPLGFQWTSFATRYCPSSRTSSPRRAAFTRKGCRCQATPAKQFLRRRKRGHFRKGVPALAVGSPDPKGVSCWCKPSSERSHLVCIRPAVFSPF